MMSCVHIPIIFQYLPHEQCATSLLQCPQGPSFQPPPFSKLRSVEHWFSLCVVVIPSLLPCCVFKKENLKFKRNTCFKIFPRFCWELTERKDGILKAGIHWLWPRPRAQLCLSTTQCVQTIASGLQSGCNLDLHQGDSVWGLWLGRSVRPSVLAVSGALLFYFSTCICQASPRTPQGQAHDIK